MEDGEIAEVPTAMAEEEDEEEEDAQHRIDKSYETLENSKASVEKIVTEMLSLKKEGKPKSQLRDLATHTFLHFVHLRQANRLILIEEDRVKAETERAKAPVDFITLQLHNLMYEKSHYVKAIKACKDFKSKYPDIDLVPEEEFFSDATEDIKSSKLSNDGAHDLMMKRLNFELFQRKELCKLQEKLEQQKKGLSETIANRKKFLSSLPSHLKSLKKASLPVQNQLGLLHTKKMKQRHSAEYLPPPLYVVYSQLLAQKAAFGEPIDLEILGSLKDAQTFAHHQENKENGCSTSESSRLEDDGLDEEEDGQRRRKRPKRVLGKESLEQFGIYQVHPLKVILHVYDDEVSEPKSQKLVSLKFEYLFKLNIVCVAIEASHVGYGDILCNLFPDDTGVELPHQSAKLSMGEAIRFDDKKTSRPYKWAQHLAGIDFLPQIPPVLNNGDEILYCETAKKEDITSGLALYRQQYRVQAILKRIRSRKKAQQALVEQLDLLLKVKWPALSSVHVPWALHNPICELHGLSLLGAQPSQATSLISHDVEPQIHEHMDVDVVGRSGTSKEGVESTREDGELPSLLPNGSVLNDMKSSSSKGSKVDHSKELSFISKSVIPPLNKSKSLSFRSFDDNTDLLLDLESDVDEPAQFEPEEGDTMLNRYVDKADSSWIDYGVKEFCLVLLRKMDSGKRIVKLEAKIEISTEYPLRPPHFALNFFCTNENDSERDDHLWPNELRAMEAEVNLRILKMIPLEQESYILAHQVCYLAMLFDHFMDDASPSSGKRSFTSVIDVGLSKPASGGLLARSFRGRDRRKMISWKDMETGPKSLPFFLMHGFSGDSGAY